MYGKEARDRENEKPIIDLTDESFRIVLEDPEKPVLVEFRVVGCAACKQVEIELTKLAMRNRDVQFARAELMLNGEALTEYDIEDVPTLILFYKSEPLDRLEKPETLKAVRDWFHEMVKRCRPRV